jgi:hypothetical protein
MLWAESPREGERRWRGDPAAAMLGARARAACRLAGAAMDAWRVGEGGRGRVPSDMERAREGKADGFGPGDMEPVRLGGRGGGVPEGAGGGGERAKDGERLRCWAAWAREPVRGRNGSDGRCEMDGLPETGITERRPRAPGEVGGPDSPWTLDPVTEAARLRGLGVGG